MKSLRVLLIEDDEDDYVLTRELFEDIYDAGFELVWAKTGDEALQQFANNQSDICLLDYRMDSTTGVELLRAANRMGYDTPIIMLTGQRDTEVDFQASQEGATDYLLKSELNSDNLGRAIRYALSRKEIESAKLQRFKAEERDRLKSEFLAHLSHELRTPLAAILGFAESLMYSLKKPENQEQAAIVYQNGKHLLSLLNDILDLSKIEAGKLELFKERVDIFSLLNEVTTLMSVQANDNGLEFSTAASNAVPRFIETDKKRLKQVLLNLSNNAIKFTPSGRIDIEMSSEQDDTNYYIRFDIRDTGIGIPEEDKVRIFKAFEHSQPNQQQNRNGAGLGLAVSKQLAALLGGRIEFDSQLGKGSRFSLFLEIAHQYASPPEVFVQERINQTITVDFEYPSISANILVVDDMRDIRLLVKRILERMEATVVCCENGVQAIDCVAESLQGKPFDLILMDLKLPYIDGFKATERIRKMGFNNPIIAFTATIMAVKKHAGARQGFNGFISKPINLVDFTSSIKTHLTNGAGTLTRPFTADGTARVLIIEDNQGAADAMAQLLTMIGVRAVVATSGHEAMLNMSGDTFDCILLDRNLPDADGLELAKTLKEKQPNTPIHLVTGETLQQVDHSIIDKVLLKPIDMKVLQDLVNCIK